jgi:hypothetical protein
VPRATWYRRRKRSARLADAWAEALDQGIDRLEEEALRRALKGTRQPVYFQGERIGSIPRYSDALLMFLLRAHRPQRYRDGPPAESESHSELRAILEEIDGKSRNLPTTRGQAE